MIGAMYSSDQKIVDLYKDKSTIAETRESKVSPDEVMNYIEFISVTNRTYIQFKPLRNIKKAS